MPLLTSVVLLIPYTQNLNTGLYGELALYLALSLFIQILANYGIDTYVSIHHLDYQDQPEKLKQFVGTLVSALLIIGIIITIAFSLSGVFLFRIIFGDEIKFFPYGFMSVITGVFNSFFRAYINFLYYRQKPIRYFFFNLFNFIITITICAAGLYMYPQTLIGPLWGRLLSGIAIFLFAFFFFAKEYGIHYKPELLTGFHKYCLPVLGFLLLTWVMYYINNYIINAFETTADVGIYDFALKCTLLIEVVQVGLLGTINPKIYQIWKNKNIRSSTLEENRYHHVFTLLSVIFIALCIFILPLVVKLLVNNEEYYASFQYLPVLCAGYAFR